MWTSLYAADGRLLVPSFLVCRRNGTSLQAVDDTLTLVSPSPLPKLLEQSLDSEEFEFPHQRDHAAEDLARRWFVEDAVKAEVAALLAGLGLDEASVEGEAHRLRATEIESADRLLTSKQQSLEKALRFIGKLRKNLGTRLRQSSAEHLEENPPPTLISRIPNNGK